MAYRLGVDLGTTFTAAAVANGMPPTMVGLGNRALQIPSVVFLTREGDFVVGESAERRGLAEPDRVVREFKRRIGDAVPILVAGSPFSPQNLTAKVLRHVCETTTERMGSAPEQIVLTHPANWGPYKLELLDQIASLADLRSVVRCPEPVAAASQYASQNSIAVGETVAVYDLGGGRSTRASSDAQQQASSCWVSPRGSSTSVGSTSTRLSSTTRSACWASTSNTSTRTTPRRSADSLGCGGTASRSRRRCPVTRTPSSPWPCPVWRRCCG